MIENEFEEWKKRKFDIMNEEKNEEALKSGRKYPSRMATPEELAKRKIKSSWAKPRNKPRDDVHHLVVFFLVLPNWI